MCVLHYIFLYIYIYKDWNLYDEEEEEKKEEEEGVSHSVLIKNGFIQG